MCPCVSRRTRLSLHLTVSKSFTLPPCPPPLPVTRPGVNVRHRAKEILQLVNDPQRLREERDKVRHCYCSEICHS